MKRLSRRALRSRSISAWVAALAALAVLSPPTGLGVRTAAAAETDAGRPLVIARDLAVTSLDPAKAFCNTCQMYLSAVYETLVGLAPDNKTIVPRLAKSWTVNPEQTVFTMNLDPAAVFADGRPVVAKDVRWSLERLRNIKAGPAFLMDGVEKIDDSDPHRVVITLAAPNSDFLGILSAPYTGVINSELAMKHGATAAADAATTDTAEAWLLANSAGSGPYVLAGYKPNDELRLERNAKYWGKKAPIGTVIMRQIKDAVAQAQLLESGGADIAMQIDPDTAKTLTSKNVVKQVLPSEKFLYLGISPGAKNAPVPLTRDVRKAIGYALNYQQMIDLTVGGQGRMQASAIPNGFPGSEGLPAPQQDLAKARELLKKAGLEKGFRIDLPYINRNQYGVDFSLLAQKVQQDLKQVGIEATLRPLTVSVWSDQMKALQVPLTIGWYSPDYFGTAQYARFFSMVEGSAWTKRAGASGNPDVMNPKEEALLAKALASGGEKSAQFYKELGEELIHDRIIIPLVNPDITLAHGKDIKGVRNSVCCNLMLEELSRD